jgi:hypothetical protein
VRGVSAGRQAECNTKRERQLGASCVRPTGLNHQRRLQAALCARVTRVAPADRRAGLVVWQGWGHTLRSCVHVALLQRLHPVSHTASVVRRPPSGHVNRRGRTGGRGGLLARVDDRRRGASRCRGTPLCPARAAPSLATPLSLTHRLARSCSLLGVAPTVPQGASDERRLATASGTFSLLDASALTPASPPSLPVAVSIARRRTGHAGAAWWRTREGCSFENET